MDSEDEWNEAHGEDLNAKDDEEEEDIEEEKDGFIVADDYLSPDEQALS
jgi:hypothetical protein